MRQSAENVAQRNKTNELAPRGGKDGKLVKASVAHDFDSRLARGVGGHGSDGLQAQGANLGIGQSISLGCLGLSCRCNGGKRWKQIVGCEPVVIGELESVSLIAKWIGGQDLILPWKGNF